MTAAAAHRGEGHGVDRIPEPPNKHTRSKGSRKKNSIVCVCHPSI